MYANRDKAALILEISGHRDESTCKNVLGLLEILIQEVREANDTAEGDTMLRNQGKVQAYNELKGYIDRGLPSANRGT